MDTTLEDRKIKLPLILAYGFTAELIPIVTLLLYVFVWGNLINPEYNLSLSQEFMTDLGILILQCVGFLSYFGVAFWIAKRSRVRTVYNGIRLLLVGVVVELLFFWIAGIEYETRFAFSFLTYLVAIVFAAVTPPFLKGKKTHLKDWDKHKDGEYEQTKRN